MKILINSTSRDNSHKQYLNYVLGSRGIEAAMTTKTLTSDDLYHMAKTLKCDGIVVCNPCTLENLVSAPEKQLTLDNFRGTRLLFGSTPCVITNPLWHLTSVPHGRWLFDSDVDKIAFGSWEGPSMEGEFVSSTLVLPHVLKEIANSVLCSVDIETNGEDVDKYYSRKVGKEELAAGRLEVRPVFITSISYSLLRLDGSIYSYVIPIVDFDREYWSEFELATVFRFLRDSMDTDAPLVFHNGVYDVLHLIQYRAWPKNWAFDTLGFQHAWYVELPKNLGFVASICCPDYKQWKFEMKQAAGARDLQQLLTYNMKDTYWTLRIALHQLQHGPEFAKKNFLKSFKMIPSSMYAHFEGMRIDNEVRLAEMNRRQAIMDDRKARLKVMAGSEDFNPGSWQQLEELFYIVLGAKKPGIGKSKSCTDEKNLQAVATQHPLFARYVTAILEYKEQSKAIGTYFKFRQRNGKLMYQLSPWVTDTGRFASQASSFNCGTQVQNIPYYAKTQLVPDEGWVWVNIDYSKVEAVITAYMAQALKLIKAVTDTERDFYMTLGELFFEIPYEEVTKDFRNKVLKKIVHGTNYMMQGKTFIENAGADNLYDGAQTLGITISNRNINSGTHKLMTMLSFANMLLEKYHEPFPEVRQFYAATKETLLREGRLTSPCGWTRLFFGDVTKDHGVLRSAVAHQPQGLAAEYMKMAVKDIFDKMVCSSDWVGDIRYKAQVHDSWVGAVRIERLGEALPLLRQHMLQTIVVHGREVTIPIDVEISTKSYGEMVELEYDKQLGKYILPDVF